MCHAVRQVLKPRKSHVWRGNVEAREPYCAYKVVRVLAAF